MSGELIRFPSPETASLSEASAAARDFFNANPTERQRRIADFRLDDPETLLVLCQLLDDKEDSGPSLVAEAGIAAYQYLQSTPPAKTKCLFDEREYYLGELSRIIGCCLRFLTRRDESREWFDRSESWFLMTANSSSDLARVAYQRLALHLEERRLGLVLELVEPLIDTFTRSGAREMALKCRYIKAGALKELGRIEDSLAEFQIIRAEAQQLNSTKVLGAAYVVLVQIYSELGQAEQALSLMTEAEPFLRTQQNRVGLGKLRWGVGLLLRQQGRLPEAILALRSAQQELLEIDLKADVAALHLVIADLLLEIGQERQAEWDIRAALPIIDELKMVPEGFAAMTLLRESLRRRSIDRQALRNLHGYFDEAGA